VSSDLKNIFDTAAGITFVRPPAIHPYGKVAVFLDLYGNKWDLVEFGYRS
jgi:hypothetical protein